MKSSPKVTKLMKAAGVEVYNALEPMIINVPTYKQREHLVKEIYEAMYCVRPDRESEEPGCAPL